jgi:hypothetical protein
VTCKCESVAGTLDFAMNAAGLCHDKTQDAPRCDDVSVHFASLSNTPSSCLSKVVPDDAQMVC